MKAEIISIGTELLLGDILNTNAQYISKVLAELGISLFFQTVVGDNPVRLETALRCAFERADLVITTGGLGPTEDDLTKEVSAKLLGKKLILDEAYLENLKYFFESRNLEMTKNNEKQAYIIENSITLENPNGTAPAVYFEENGKILILLPGPPKEMIPIFENSVVPLLKEKQVETYVSQTLKVCGIGESSLETTIKDIISEQKNPTIAPYAKSGGVVLRLTASAKNKEEAEKILEPVYQKLVKRLGDSIIGDENMFLETSIFNILCKHGLSISTAESATGGMIASTLINQVGMSKVFKEGFVVYTDQSKIERLLVQAHSIELFSAVSPEVCIQMAQNACKISGSDVSISISGYLGENNGLNEDQKGLVYICNCIKGKTKVYENIFRGERNKARERASEMALVYLRKDLLGFFGS